ncbi:MAG TPA: GNAT family N-acetyltransferase [Gaiellaceae bacterium]
MELRLDRPSTVRHYEQWAAILKRVSGDVFDVDEIAHFVESDRKSAFLLATREDEAVGCGVGRPSSIQSSLYAMVRVLPEHRGEGVGSRILEALSDHARSLGRNSLWGRIREDDGGSRRFARNRGFREAGREYEVVLDTALANVSAQPPEGIELVSLAGRPDLAEAVHEVDCEVSGDVPRPEGDDFEATPYPWWRELYLEGPGAVPDAMIAALAGDEVVGYTGLRRRGSTSPIAENMLTAVRREWRRRGIATALKREQIARARAAGIEQIFTTNDETNTGMRGVNARLGYRPAPTQIVVTGPLAPT